MGQKAAELNCRAFVVLSYLHVAKQQLLKSCLVPAGAAESLGSAESTRHHTGGPVIPKMCSVDKVAAHPVHHDAHKQILTSGAGCRSSIGSPASGTSAQTTG